jgi:hypothetical protein
MTTTFAVAAVMHRLLKLEKTMLTNLLTNLLPNLLAS